MPKLDWSKANIYKPDPARVQEVNDFVQPDPVVLSVTPSKAKRLTPAERDEIAVNRILKGVHEFVAQCKAARRAANFVAAEAQEAAALAAKRAEEEARREARREALQTELAAKNAAAEAWKQSPEYAAQKRAEEEQAAEHRETLRAQREQLRQRWREELLKR